MGLNLREMNTIFFDTAPFIYYLEDNPYYADKIEKIISDIFNKKIQIITSIITYIEIITVPKRKQDEKIVAKYRDFFTNSENISLYPLNLQVAEETAYFRVKYNLKTPDAIQLATAKNCGADYIITNDKEWKKIDIIKVLLIDEIE